MPKFSSKNMFGSKKRFRFLLESLPNTTKEETLRENHLEPILVFAPVQTNIQNLVSPDYSSSLKNPVS